MLPIAIGIHVRIALACLGLVATTSPIGCRIVLNNEVIPIGYPQMTIRAHLRGDRRKPLIGTGDQRGSVDGLVSRAIGHVLIHPQEISGRATDEGHGILPRFRKGR